MKHAIYTTQYLLSSLCVGFGHRCSIADEASVACDCQANGIMLFTGFNKN